LAIFTLGLTGKVGRGKKEKEKQEGGGRKRKVHLPVERLKYHHKARSQ
jgi:hypothetical protein